MTRLSLMIFLRSEGLPTGVKELRELFFKFHLDCEGIGTKLVEDDLNCLRNYLSSQRTEHLASAQISFDDYYKRLAKSNGKGFH